MTTFDTRNNHQTYDTATHKVVPKDAVVLDLSDESIADLNYLARHSVSDASFDQAKMAHHDAIVTLSNVLGHIEAQTKPARIPEPGLWGVVEAWKRGIPTRRWVHHEEDRWVSDAGHIAGWDELDQAVLIRPGIEDES